jgi:HNH endonuclease
MHPQFTQRDSERFWSKVDRSGGPDACWPWLKHRNPKGYGQAWDGRSLQLAHRVAWELVNGPIPDGLSALHRCDNPPCCNPAHIFLGTQADNIADAARKERLAHGGQNGSHTHPERRARGEGNGAARLTDDQVAEIRRRYAAGGVTQRVLAREFGISPSHVCNLIRGRWRQT